MAATRRFRLGRSRNRRDPFLSGYRYLVIHGPRQRYTAEFCPFLIFTFLLFLRSGQAAFHLRYVLVALVTASTVINSLTTVSWLIGADMNVPAATRAKWNEFLGRTSRHKRRKLRRLAPPIRRLANFCRAALAIVDIRWTISSTFSTLKFPNDHHAFSLANLARRRWD